MFQKNGTRILLYVGHMLLVALIFKYLCHLFRIHKPCVLFTMTGV